MRVVEDGEAVGGEFADLFEGAAEGAHGLQRQAVDEVGADAVVTGVARGGDGVAHVCKALDAVHRLLYRRVEVLHAEADAVKAQLAQEAQVVRADGARVDFDAVFALSSAAKRGEMLVQHGEQAAQLRVVEGKGSGVPPPEVRVG